MDGSSGLMSNVEFFTSEGCLMSELHNTPEDPAVSVARIRVPAGVTTEQMSRDP
jgi:hypothetical protein